MPAGRTSSIVGAPASARNTCTTDKGRSHSARSKSSSALHACTSSAASTPIAANILRFVSLLVSMISPLAFRNWGSIPMRSASSSRAGLAGSCRRRPSTDHWTVQGPKVPSSPTSPSCQSTRPGSAGKPRAGVADRFAANTNASPARSGHRTRTAPSPSTSYRPPAWMVASSGTISARRIDNTRRYQSNHSECGARSMLVQSSFAEAKVSSAMGSGMRSRMAGF